MVVTQETYNMGVKLVELFYKTGVIFNKINKRATYLFRRLKITKFSKNKNDFFIIILTFWPSAITTI